MAVRITPKQSRRIHGLIPKRCTNYDHGNCLLLDDGETCQCVQMISEYRIYCTYFMDTVLPAEEDLCAEIMQPQRKKRCAVCGKAFVPGSNRQKYCPDCRITEMQKKDRLRKQRKRHSAVRI